MVEELYVGDDVCGVRSYRVLVVHCSGMDLVVLWRRDRLPRSTLSSSSEASDVYKMMVNDAPFPTISLDLCIILEF